MDLLNRPVSTVDLHLHSTASDGSYTPEELVETAHASGLKTISITDHDSVAGVRPGQARARELGLELLPAIELTASYDGMLIDILGYLIDLDVPWFVEILDDIFQKRMSRAEAMVSKLIQAGYALSWEQVLSLSRGGFVCGVHILHALYAKGYLKNPTEIWSRLYEFFNREGPAYVPNNLEFRSACEIIRIIHDLGGIAVIAHPGRYQREVNIKELRCKYDLDGLEAFYSTYTAEQSEYYQQMAIELNLLATGGSDFHGIYSKGEIKLGELYVPPQTVLNLSRCWIKRSKK